MSWIGWCWWELIPAGHSPGRRDSHCTTDTRHPSCMAVAYNSCNDQNHLTIKLMTDVIPHWGKTHWGKIHWSIVCHIVRPVSSARAPKTGARLTETWALAHLPHWGMNIDMYGQEWTIKFIEKYFIFFLTIAILSSTALPSFPFPNSKESRMPWPVLCCRKTLQPLLVRSSIVCTGSLFIPE